METECKEFQLGKTPIRIYVDKVYIGSHVIEREYLQRILKVQDSIQPPKIEFQWDTFLEEDESWDALFFKINGSRWFLAKINFGTEDEGEIRNKINSNKEFWINFANNNQ